MVKEKYFENNRRMHVFQKNQKWKNSKLLSAENSSDDEVNKQKEEVKRLKKEYTFAVI